MLNPMRKARVREAPTPKYLIHLPEEERPAARLVRFGPASLHPNELLAILLGNDAEALDDANRLLGDFESLRGLRKVTTREMMDFGGLTQAQASIVAAAIELGRRIEQMGIGEKDVVNNPNDVARLLGQMLRDEKREHFYAVMLDVKNTVVKLCAISIGTLDSSLVNPRELFREAIREGAASVIVAHNHPSGDPTPSSEDIQVTRRLVQAGDILGLPVRDHIIVGSEHEFVSFKQRGLM